MFKIVTILSLIISLFVFLMPIVSGKIIYVDDNASVSLAIPDGSENDGSSWENAYNHLQDALVDSEIAKNRPKTAFSGKKWPLLTSLKIH